MDHRFNRVFDYIDRKVKDQKKDTALFMTQSLKGLNQNMKELNKDVDVNNH